MKQVLDMKFEDFPLNVPSEKRIVKKLESLVQELEECGSALTASIAIRHWNKYMTQLQTDQSIIYVRYSCDTKNPVYKRAQDRVDELSQIVHVLLERYKALLKENAQLREDAERQRQELIRTHSELQELQQKNRRLATANALTAAEGNEEATKRLNALIAQVDRAIAALKR